MMTQMTDLVLAQLESLAEDGGRSADECRLLKIHLRELKSEFARLYKIEEAAYCIAKQTNAERAYSLHDDLIAALEVSNVELTGSRAGSSPVSPATEGSEVERRVSRHGEGR